MLDQFTEIIPENRIILSKGQFTEKYYDSKRKIQHFSEKRLKLIRRNNYFLDKINNYLMYKLPKIKIIDLTDKNYIGSCNHPYGNSPSHYENAYYKEYLKRLNEIVRRDLQEERYRWKSRR